MPHGGTRFEGQAHEKDIDTLYVGGFKSDEQINFAPLPFGDSEVFYDYVIGYYEKREYVEAQDAAMDYAMTSETEYSSAQIAVMTNYIVRSVEAYYVAERRKGLIRYLAKQGFVIHICGNEVWRKIAQEYPENIIFEGMKTPRECPGFIARAKVLINDLPYFADGSHERIFNGILNQAVVLSNKSRYLEERFTDGESILFWDGRDYGAAAEKIGKVLSNDEYRKSIVKNSLNLTSRDSWRDRFDQCISDSLQ